ncbi:uncharacterized protein [Venturia canescens]|uniref:uncharacterized protein n=1 Tax=Venturia canescens TaxID=32260 RepID=UPI001C9CAC13|nr:uncharacterized protein LOC122405591 [Venturia canescens]
MKTTIFLYALVVIAYLFVGGNAEDEVKLNCNDVRGDLSLYYKICGEVICHPNGSISSKGCGTYQCSPDKPAIGYKETDSTKPYPECCGGPICPD